MGHSLIFAIRDGLKDVREGKPYFFWALLTDPAHRREHLGEAWKAAARVFGFAVIMDAIYQYIVLRWFYPGEAASLVAAAPGLYTVGGAGGGQLQAQNADFSRNSSGLGASAAARGSYVIVYANGLGPTNPPVATGQRTPVTPGSAATLPITASIGGQPAQVLYAGLAPGYVGLYQLNIAAPQNASTGDRVPLTITINGVPSQDNVTIAAR